MLAISQPFKTILRHFATPFKYLQPFQAVLSHSQVNQKTFERKNMVTLGYNLVTSWDYKPNLMCKCRHLTEAKATFQTHSAFWAKNKPNQILHRKRARNYQPPPVRFHSAW